MEAEARAILTALFAEKKPASKGLASMIQNITKMYAIDDEALPLPERKAKTSTVGIKTKRAKAGWDNQYLLKILGGI